MFVNSFLKLIYAEQYINTIWKKTGEHWHSSPESEMIDDNGGDLLSIAREVNESDLQYHKRLVYGKLIDKSLQDIDYAELSELVYGKKYSSDVARRMMYGSCKTLQLCEQDAVNTATNDENISNLISELDNKKIELQIEKQKFYDQRNAWNKLTRERARAEELNEIIENAINNGSLPELPIVEKNIDFCDSDSDLLVSLNDLHFGAYVDNYWCQYNSSVCAEMLSEYADKVISITKSHNIENCIVWANGDCISGNIHKSIQITNKENVIEQVMGVSELISQFLYKLSSAGVFKTVQYVSVAGNHSRIESKEDALKDERMDDLIEWYLKARLQSQDNIFIGVGEKIDSTMYVMNVRGKLYVGVHGDFDPSPTKLAALQQMVGRPIYAILLGHLHHNKIDSVQGIKTIMAGSFLGMDDYCVSKRIYGHPEQLACVCNKDGLVCPYFIEFS